MGTGGQGGDREPELRTRVSRLRCCICLRETFPNQRKGEGTMDGLFVMKDIKKIQGPGEGEVCDKCRHVIENR